MPITIDDEDEFQADAAPAPAPAAPAPPMAMGGSPNYNPPPSGGGIPIDDGGFQPDPEPSLWDQAKNFASGTMDTMGRQVRAADRGLRQVLPWSDEISAAAGAAEDVLTRPSGLAGVVRGPAPTFADRYQHHLAQERGMDDKAAEESPGFFYGTQVAGGLAVPPVASAIKGVGTGAKLARGAALLGEGAFMGAGASRADTTEGVLEDAALGAGFAGALGAAGKLLGGKGPRGADAPKGRLEQGYEAEMRADITAGANPTHARRAMPDREAADMMIDWVERTKPVKRALDGPREKVAEAASEELTKLSAKTAPVYPKFDEAAGTIPTWEIADHFDDAVNTIKRSHSENSEGLVQALEAAKKKILGVAEERGEDFLTHKDMRDETTNLLREKQRTVGSIAETPLYVYKDEVHKVADQFLRDRMDIAAAITPSLTKDLAMVRATNRDISSAARLEAVANNADQLDMWKARPPSKKARDLVSRGAPTSVAGGLAGGPVGVALGALAPPLVESLTKKGMLYLGQIARARRLGQSTDGLIQRAVEAGVPLRAARTAASIGNSTSARPPMVTESTEDPDPYAVQ
jgi:hypothetical protein